MAVVLRIETGEGSSLKEPGTAVVILLIAGKSGQLRCCKPCEIIGEPFLYGGEVRF